MQHAAMPQPTPNCNILNATVAMSHGEEGGKAKGARHKATTYPPRQPRERGHNGNDLPTSTAVRSTRGNSKTYKRERRGKHKRAISGDHPATEPSPVLACFLLKRGISGLFLKLEKNHNLKNMFFFKFAKIHPNVTPVHTN